MQEFFDNDVVSYDSRTEGWEDDYGINKRYWKLDDTDTFDDEKDYN
jgi:hypothetical protein